MISQLPERPPYVIFEVRTEEDRNKTIEQGRYIAKDVDFVVITPAGSKDSVERKALDWLSDINMKASSNPPRFNPAHASYFQSAYKAWKENQEVPTSGTPINGWPAVSPAQQQNLLSLNIRTVEDLASMNDSGLQRIGMGARALQNKAIAWISSANDHGKVSEEVSALRVKMEEQDRKIASLMDANRTLLDQVAHSDHQSEPKQKRPYNRRPREEVA